MFLQLLYFLTAWYGWWWGIIRVGWYGGKRFTFIHEYDGDNTPVVTGSAGGLNGEIEWVTKINDLMAVDSWIPEFQLEIMKHSHANRRCIYDYWKRNSGYRKNRNWVNTGDGVDIIGMGAEKLHQLLLELRCLERSR